MNLSVTSLGRRQSDSAPVDAAAKEFEDFIYLVSHDVRNSVRALLELPQWIEEDLETAGHPPTRSLKENIQLMNTHTRRLDRMLIDLLIYSRIGRMQCTARVCWNDAIDAVLDQIPIPQGFQLIRDIQSPGITMGETDALTLISSLMSNAIKHHDRPEGTIRITTSFDGGEHGLTVSDDGPGIPEKYRDKVLEVMTTLKPRDEVEGSGMGLANVRKIANFYGGRLKWGNSPVQRGCSLSVVFPGEAGARH